MNASRFGRRALCALMLTVSIGGQASATSCDLKAISERSAAQSASELYNSSDLLGLGYVRSIDNGKGSLRQEVHFVVVFKGDASVVELEPLRVNGVEKIDNFYRDVSLPTGAFKVIPIKATPSGGVLPKCLTAIASVADYGEITDSLIDLAKSHHSLRVGKGD